MSTDNDNKKNQRSDNKENMDEKTKTNSDAEYIKGEKEPEDFKKKYDELQERFIRLAADFDNYRKRVTKEKSDIAEYGNEELVKSLLDVMDNLERALLHAETNDKNASLLEGVRLVYNQLNSLLQKFGVEQIDASKGSSFDPRYHQAFEKVETEKLSPGMILEEMVKGYTFKGRLLRPAVVSVATETQKKKKEEKSQQASQEQSKREEESNIIEIAVENDKNNIKSGN